MSSESLPPWDEVLSAAARRQRLVPDTVLVGGTAAAIYAGHRVSRDADHVLTDLRQRFDGILSELESVAGWRTARVNRPVLILGSLDGIETGIRQLIREAPLETREIEIGTEILRVPTEAEILRIKAVLVLRRNAARDYVDFVALADHLGTDAAFEALRSFDRLYSLRFSSDLSGGSFGLLATIIPNADGFWEFVDTDAIGRNRRFYQLTFP